MKQDQLQYDIDAIVAAAKRVFGDDQPKLIAGWSRAAGVSGELVRLFMNRRVIKITTLEKLVRPLGMRTEIVVKTNPRRKSA